MNKKQILSVHQRRKLFAAAVIKGELWAFTGWEIEDVRVAVHNLKGQDWDNTRCLEFLWKHEETILDTMILAGNEMIEGLISEEID
jgi:hypothetical protein